MQKIYDVDELLRDFRTGAPPARGTLVTLHGIDGLDGYNPSAGFRYDGQTFNYVRVEPREDEFASWSLLFRQTSPDVWDIDPGQPMFHLQDPFASVIHGELVVGGVRILSRQGERVSFKTVLLRGDSPTSLTEFAHGPLNMKDVRLVELESGKVGIFTRPLGGMGGRGRIGYVEVEGLDAVDTSVIEHADLLTTQPIEEQWWGVNDAHLLPDGTIGVIGHIARLDGNNRNYYAIAFVLDRKQRSIVRGPAIIAERSCFPDFPPKRPDLKDVVFPGGFDRTTGLFLGGVSDSAVGALPVDDPFGERPRAARD